MLLLPLLCNKCLSSVSYCYIIFLFSLDLIAVVVCGAKIAVNVHNAGIVCNAISVASRLSCGECRDSTWCINVVGYNGLIKLSDHSRARSCSKRSEVPEVLLGTRLARLSLYEIYVRMASTWGHWLRQSRQSESWSPVEPQTGATEEFCAGNSGGATAASAETAVVACWASLSVRTT